MRISPICSSAYPQKASQPISKSFEHAKVSNKVAENIKTFVLPTAVALLMLNPTTSVTASGKSLNTHNTEVVEKKEDNNLPYYLQKESIQYSKKFEMDGKEYTMYYTDYCQKFSDRKKAVLEIFFVPEDFKLHKNGQSELNSPPKLVELVYHDLDNSDENFVSAVISEATCEEDGSNYQQIFREIILPEKIGKKLLDLYSGKTKYRLVKGVDTYTETSSKELMKPIIQRGRTVLK